MSSLARRKAMGGAENAVPTSNPQIGRQLGLRSWKGEHFERGNVGVSDSAGELRRFVGSAPI